MDAFPVTIHHNPNCGTSRNALALFRAAGYAPRVVPYLETGWTRSQLEALFDAMGMRPREALRVAGELRVDHRVALAVVADEHPADRGEVRDQPAQARELVLAPAAEPAGVGRPPVAQQQRAAGEAVVGQEARQRPGRVPRAAGRDARDNRMSLRLFP